MSSLRSVLQESDPRLRAALVNCYMLVITLFQSNKQLIYWKCGQVPMVTGTQQSQELHELVHHFQSPQP